MIKGLKEIEANLNKYLKSTETKMIAGMVTAAIMVRRDTEKVSPKTPVDTGNLRSSFAIVTSFNTTPDGASPKFKGDGKDEAAGVHAEFLTSAKAETKKQRYPNVVLGFSANYALMVHEKTDAKFQRPGAGAKFFETHLKNNAQKIKELIGGSIKI